MVRNKIAAILAAAAILSVSAVSADAPYTDLGSLTDRAAVDYLYDTQCLTFITGDTFEPNRVLTRGDLAQLLYNSAANIPWHRWKRPVPTMCRRARLVMP